MRKIIVLSLIATALGASAQQRDPFAELESAIEAQEAEGSEAEMQAFKAWKDEYLAQYQKFREEHFNRMDDIRDKLLDTWGQAEVSDNSKVVEYQDDSKTVIDFEKNEIRISILHDEDEDVSPAEAQRKLHSLIDESSQSSSDTRAVVKSFLGADKQQLNASRLIEKAAVEETEVPLEEDRSAVIAQQKALIEAQTRSQQQQIEKIVDSDVDEAPPSDDDDQAKQQRINQELIKLEKEKNARLARLEQQAQAITQSSDKRAALKNKKITTYTIPLENKKHTDRAQQFVGAVKQNSQKRHLSPSLVLAVMHTESYFNPKAESHVPAYGLMQIVPRTAGHDVNRFLFNKDEPMAVDVLLEPERNIEAGSAYLYILYNRYLKKITDPQSRLYCVIAAYNTGTGNIAKTFNTDGSRNINKAAAVINSMTPEQVYQHLLKNLPYEETRNYLQKVTNRQSIYTFLDNA